MLANAAVAAALAVVLAIAVVRGRRLAQRPGATQGPAWQVGGLVVARPVLQLVGLAVVW